MNDFLYQLCAWAIASFFIVGFCDLREKHKGWAFAICMVGAVIFDAFLNHFRGVHP